MRRRRVRPPHLRLLGGRRPRLQGPPGQLAARRRGRVRERPVAGPSCPRQPVPRRPRGARQPVRAEAGRSFNPFTLDADDDALADNPFAPRRAARPTVAPGAPPKLALLGRGLAVFGSYAKVLLVVDEDGERPAAYTQFGPLSAYPRALRLRELYPKLPRAPLPAVVTCVAVTAADRGRGLGLRLVEAVCEDLAARGFTAVEAYPEVGRKPDTTSAATPAFWERAGFAVVVDDERYPVVRREL